MSTPAYVVLPLEGEGAQAIERESIQGVKITSPVGRSINEEVNLQYQHGPLGKAPSQTKTKHHGPLKTMLENQGGFSHYLNWEDPTRTLCSYLGVLGILIVAHYLPFTHLALKAGAITLGATTAMEFASRTFGPNTFLGRLRPKPYKTIPEDTLNATLKDIHDLVQFTVKQAQRIIFAQDLDKTFLTFLALAATFLLSNTLSPFALSILGLTTLYIITFAAASIPSEQVRVKGVARRAMSPIGTNQASEYQAPSPPAPTYQAPSPPAPAYPVKLKEQQEFRHVPPTQPRQVVSGEDERMHHATGMHPLQAETTGAPLHQRRVSGQELRETNFGHRRVGSRGSVDGSADGAPNRSFSSSIPVATTWNGAYRHTGGSW